MFFTQTYEVIATNKATREECVIRASAKSKKSLEHSLEGRYIVHEIRRLPTDLEKLLDTLTFDPVNEQDVLRLLSFLAQAMSRGVRFRKALEFLAASEEKRSVRELLTKMITRLEEQFTSYYDIFQGFPEHFDASFLGIVRAGESSGTLADNIAQFVVDRNKLLKQKREIIGVLTKRGVLFGIVMLIAAVIISFVIPQFNKLFVNTNAAPSILVILNYVATFIKNYGLLLLGSIVGGVVFLMFFIKQNYRARKIFDEILVRFPIAGEVLRTYHTCQYLYFAGTLLMKNVSYIKIMDILIEQTASVPFKEVFEIMRENIIKGVSLSEMLRRSDQNLETNYRKIPTGYLLPSLAQALEMGAATGSMGQTLYDAFLSYEIVLHQKIQKAIKIFDAVFYAFIILVMGLLFAAMGAAMLALYKNAGKIV